RPAEKPRTGKPTGGLSRDQRGSRPKGTFAVRNPIPQRSLLPLLVTDGMDPRQGDEAAWVRRIGREGLGTTMESLCREEREDEACTRVPRFKVSDDKTGLLIRFHG